MKRLVALVLLMQLNVPLAVWDIATPWVVSVCHCESGGAQDKGRALVTVRCPTEVDLTCADLAIDKAARVNDAQRARRRP